MAYAIGEVVVVGALVFLALLPFFLVDYPKERR